MTSYISLFLSSLLLVTILFLSIFAFKKKNKHGSKPSLPPSPPRLTIIGNLHQLGNLPHRSLQKLSKEYGPLMLMQLGSKPTVVISSAETAREVLKTHDLDFCSRPSLAGPKRLSYNFLDIAFVPYGEYWKEMRKICVLELFSAKKVQSFRFVREEEVAHMIKSISASSSSPVNLTEKLFSLKMNHICRVAFGKKNRGRDSDNENFHEMFIEAINLHGSFTATDFFPYFGWIIDVFTGHSRRLEKCFHAFDTFYQQVIDEHLDPQRTKPEQEDIIDVLIRLQNEQSGALNLTVSHIKSILKDIFLGGVDTGASTMVWGMTELARKPEVMKKVQEEIRNCVGNKGMLEESDIDNLEYFKMVVKETFRMHPPTIFLIPRECMNHCKINGYDIYPKTRVLVNVWAIGRSSEYWENPDEFIPERFINSSIDFKGQDFELLPFGSGRRICPAISMGTAMIELGLANLLYHFNWELPSKDDINMDEIAGLTVHKKIPLHLVPIPYNCK
ncbi:hypothetical protein AQUCO_01100443v1 [Aquilegia coerulea]|uniref:Cytochrome P450 n=1 Tax=Aquilegia coerulea TaxID=218851 RepID=A0A2G5E7P7_AQUCA|nr:hypothetical protein AQUCO_01100443v1 [Aquilegia coerulea]